MHFRVSSWSALLSFQHSRLFPVIITRVFKPRVFAQAYSTFACSASKLFSANLILAKSSRLPTHCSIFYRFYTRQVIMAPVVKEYGAWTSPITSEIAAGSEISFAGLERDSHASSASNTIYWVEQRPAEGGRCVVCSWDPESKEIVTWTPKDYSVKSRVHEYGGGAFCVFKNQVYFVNKADQGIYMQPAPEAPVHPVTQVDASRRFADLHYSEHFNALFAVCEDRGVRSSAEERDLVKPDIALKEVPDNYLVSVAPATGKLKCLVQGADFYASPRTSCDGQLLWMEWNNPDMPWDVTKIKWAKLASSEQRVDPTAIQELKARNGKTDVAFTFPEFASSGQILYASDEDNWWNLFQTDSKQKNKICLEKTDQDLGHPLWIFGFHPYSAVPSEKGDSKESIVMTYGDELSMLTIEDDRVERKVIDTGFKHNHLYYVQSVRSGVYGIGFDAKTPMTLFYVDFDTLPTAANPSGDTHPMPVVVSGTNPRIRENLDGSTVRPGFVQPPYRLPFGTPRRFTSRLEYLAETVFKNLMNNYQLVWPFKSPVNADALKIRNYYQVIANPMDLGTIEKRLDNYYYRDGDDCIRDFKQIFVNCYAYNPDESDVVKMARQLEKVFLAELAGMPAEEVELPVPSRAIGRKTPQNVTIVRASASVNLDGYLSTPEEIEFPTSNGEVAYGYYYPPKNQDFQEPEGTFPPVLVKLHGGPTSKSYAQLKLTTQFYTSRGFGVLDVNYRGSSGYGREFRQKLNLKWGVSDVEDAVNGARYLVSKGLADPNRLCIAGGSAGGLTVLNSLLHHDVFKAGASHYGVTDLEALVADTHKFEARYLDSMVGAYPAMKSVYEERSPILHKDKLKCPTIFFQGTEDAVVPPSQSEKMYEAVKAKGLPCAYVLYEGEGHGFTKKENIQNSLETEYAFFVKVFGIDATHVQCSVKFDNISA